MMSSSTGVDCFELQVKEPEKYGFKPKELLNSITDIYLHLDSKQLAEAVASDEVRKSLPLHSPSLPFSLSPLSPSLPLSRGPIVRRCLMPASV